MDQRHRFGVERDVNFALAANDDLLVEKLLNPDELITLMDA
jgi:hypothetical protein